MHTIGTSSGHDQNICIEGVAHTRYGLVSIHLCEKLQKII